MARELGVSKATVQRVWSDNEIKPHLTRVFKLSTDPDFEAKFWVSPPICKPDKSNGLEFRFDLPFSCQASAKTLLHLVLFSSMCRLIPYLVPGGPSANTESASDFPTGGVIRFFRRCSQAGLGLCRMSRARAAKAGLARRSCARSLIKPRGHRGAGRDGLAARWPASWEAPRRPCSGSGVTTK